jgi:hypothetical protein
MKKKGVGQNKNFGKSQFNDPREPAVTVDATDWVLVGKVKEAYLVYRTNPKSYCA